MVVPYIGTWIETEERKKAQQQLDVVPYIGTWIETQKKLGLRGKLPVVVPYIGTWIETQKKVFDEMEKRCRTLYRYVD